MTQASHLRLSGALFTFILFLWPVMMAIDTPRGDMTTQLTWVSEHASFYKWQFMLALLISPSILYLMITQAVAAGIQNSIPKYLGLLFLGVYASLNGISYGSQIVLLPRMIEAGMEKEAISWYFGSAVSIPYFINQLGYLFWAMGAIILFSPFLNHGKILKWISRIYLLSGILSVLAFIGLIIPNQALSTLTFPSGLMLLPVGILSILWGSRQRKQIS